MRLFYVITYLATGLFIASLILGSVFYLYSGFVFALEDKFVICHYPPGNPLNPQTIEVAEPALNAHFEHGDTLGACPEPTPTPTPTPTPIFLPQDGTENATTSVKVTQDFEINIIAPSGNSQVVLEQDTVISRIASEQFSISELTSSQADVNTLTGLAEGKVFEAALQWGIPNITLQFSKPITIKIFVGTELDGKTLDVVRSPDGQNWTDEGIVAPATCLISGGICLFQATKASFYAALGSTPPPVSASAGAVVPLAFLNSGAGILSSDPTPVVVVPSSVPVPEITTTPTPMVMAIAPKVFKSTVTKVQKNPEPTPAVQVEQKPLEAKRNLLSNIFSSIFDLFHWPF